MRRATGDPMTDGDTQATTPPHENGGSLMPAARLRIVRVFPWHMGAFLVGNLLLQGVNWLVGGSWWALCLLVATALVLTVHYLFYKTATASERWAQARAEELNLKSYDRSHIEDLKSRYGASDHAGDRRG